jgi:hypothetical protein
MRRARGVCHDGGNTGGRAIRWSGQADEEPDRQRAVALVVADVLEAVAVLGVVEALLLDLSAAFG